MIDKFKILLPYKQPKDSYIFFDTPNEYGSYDYFWVNNNHVSLETNRVGSDVLLDKYKESYSICHKNDENFDIIMKKILKYINTKMWDCLSKLNNLKDE